MPDKIAKIFALASKNLVLSMGKLFHFQIFTDFLKLHLFLDLDALCDVGKNQMFLLALYFMITYFLIKFR